MEQKVEVQAKVYLFLQGPNCGFFSGIAQRLESLGHRCLKVNLCFGDWLYWRRPGAINYRGSLGEWQGFLIELLEREGVTSILMNGEQRSYHKIARGLAKELGIEVVVTDFGYLRPGWITLERNGMSGDSLFAKNREEIEELAELAPEFEALEKFQDSFLKMAFAEVISTSSSWILGFLYPGYRSFHLNNPILFLFCVGVRMMCSRWCSSKTENLVCSLVTKKMEHPFFLFPLQLEMDFQIRAYSKYPNQLVILEEAIRSFANHAEASARLVFKIHPLDPGLTQWGEKIATLAAISGIAERVFFLDGGSLETLLEHSVGVVTINSTVGVTALQKGKPLKTLGQAVYEISDLVFPEELDRFWTAKFQPDLSLRDAFLKALAATIQIRGAYFDKSGLKSAIHEASERLHRGYVGKIAPLCR